MKKLKPCPYCNSKAEYWEQSDSQVSAIYCSECPLGLEEDQASYEYLAGIWNELPRNK